MPSNTLRKFDDSAISNIFSVLKANLGQKTDAIKLKYVPNPGNNYSYFVVDTDNNAVATNTVNAEKIADTLNDLYSLVKVNGAITLSNNTYVGTGNAVTASDLATIFTSLLTMINDIQGTLTFDEVPTDGSDNPVKSNGIFDALAEKFDIDSIDDEVLDNTGANTAVTHIMTMFDSNAAVGNRDRALNDLSGMLQSSGNAFFDVATGKTDYLPNAQELADTYDNFAELLGVLCIELYPLVWTANDAISNVDSTPTVNSSHLVTSGGVAAALADKVDTTKIDTTVEVDTLENQGKIPTNQAVATYVQNAISGMGGVSFQICGSGEFSGNMQTFTGNAHGTPTAGTTTTSYPYTLTETPKKINSVTFNGLQVQFTYSGSTTHIITITLPNETVPTSTDSLIVNYVPYPIIGTPQSNTFYLVPNDGTGTNNIYNEYVWISNTWELIGSTENDFSQYVKYEDLETITVEELTSLFTAATPANVQSGS